MCLGIDLIAPPPTDACEPCVVANLKVEPHTGHIKLGRYENDYIYSDLQGPFDPSWDSFIYMITFLCDKTLRAYIFLLKDKSATSVVGAFRLFASMVEHSDKKITRLRSDCGTEYDNLEMLDFRLSKGIIWKPTVPGNPQMNGKSERLG